MPSAKKTPNLGLNDWDPSDKPKREDFNSDNAILDSQAGGHLLNGGIHCTPAEKELWNSPYRISHYVGTGTASRQINCEFAPRLVLVFTHNQPPVEYVSVEGKHYIHAAMATQSYFSTGINLNATGFTILQGSSQLNSNLINDFNKTGVFYIYIAIK